MSAIAAYVRTLTKHYGGGRARLERETRISKDRIRQIEAGEEEPTLEELCQIVDTVQGNLSDIQRLILNSGSEDYGVQHAKTHIERTKHTPLKQQFDDLDHHELIEVVRYILNRLEQQSSSAASPL